MDRKIPIYNIYHILCYAWDVLKEKDVVKVDIPDDYSMLEFFAKILNSGTSYLIRRGLDRGYVECNDEIPSIKGKIDFSQSLNKLSFQNAKSYCIYDNFTYDVLHNRILKTTFGKILKIKEIDKELKNEISQTIKYFSDVSYTNINRKVIKSVKLNRNNHLYKLLLEICLLIEENLSINEDTGEATFTNFFEDRMETLFERFVFNYYKKNLGLRNPDKKVYVHRENIEWMVGETMDEESRKYLPIMKTDVSISIDDRKIILDAKYYQENLKTNQYDQEKLSSSNLYQLFSYIQNYIDRENVEGILLYPTIDKELDLEYVIKGSKMKINTVNLGLEDWKEIERQLEEVISI